MLDRLRHRIEIANWSRLPAPLWALVASPLLHFAWGSGRWVQWPKGSSKSPFAPTFWHVGSLWQYRDNASLWYRPNGQPRALKPSNFDNPITDMLMGSLLAGTPPCPLKLWERLLIGLGF